tara:strand:- start:32 stop:220 length:189 start_codon:yes stop_codon:yes gene_type:complete
MEKSKKIGLTPSILRGEILQKLDLYSEDQVKIGIVKFLNFDELIKLKDSLDREVFYNEKFQI